MAGESGRAGVMWSLVIPAVLALAAVATDQAALMVLAFVLGPLVFAWQLMSAEAPFPIEVSDATASDPAR